MRIINVPETTKGWGAAGFLKLTGKRGDIHLDNKICFYPDYSVELQHNSTEGIPQVVEVKRVAVSIFHMHGLFKGFRIQSKKPTLYTALHE